MPNDYTQCPRFKFKITQQLNILGYVRCKRLSPIDISKIVFPDFGIQIGIQLGQQWLTQAEIKAAENKQKTVILNIRNLPEQCQSVGSSFYGLMTSPSGFAKILAV